MDTFSAQCRSIRGYNHVLILVFKRGWLVKAYPTKAKSDTLAFFRQFLTDIGIPEMVFSDGAGEFVLDEELLEELRLYKIKQHTSEPHHQHQNPAEGKVRNVKHVTDYLISLTSTPINR